MSYKHHLFICTNKPEGRTDRCGYKDSEDLRKKIKEQAQNRFGKDVRINASGCLGHCEKGIAAVLYPQGEWKFDLKNSSEDVQLAIDWISKHHSDQENHK